MLAVLGMSAFLDEEDVSQVLFGTDALVIDTGELIRRSDGLWCSTDGPSAKGVSAVLVGTAINPWSITHGWPRLWLNPWATRPLKPDHFPFPQAYVEDERLVLTDETRSASDVLGLKPEWPGDPKSRFSRPAR
jgi:hypothetical protein